MQAMTGMGHEVFVLSTLRSYNRDGDAALERQTAAAAAAEAGRIAAAWETGAAPKADLLFTYHVYHKAADYLGPALKQRCRLPYIIAEPSVAPKREHGPWAAGYAQAGMALRRADVLQIGSASCRERVCQYV